MLALVLKAFLFRAQLYAAPIDLYSHKYKQDPLLVSSVIHEESRFARVVRSSTNDYGLMGLHVGPKTHAKYVGREHLLYNAKLNIKLGTKMMAFWRRHHYRRCCAPGVQGCLSYHHWLQHYNSGYRVYSKGRAGSYSERVLGTYKRLKRIKERMSALTMR